jgi:sterol desaturase/sphingolipid hydroxylase (fatty acid hydroxylase superfamily)
MSEFEFQVIKSVGFVFALAATIGIQRVRPHADFQGSWRVNGGLWAVNIVVLGLLCGGCACTVSLWAEAKGYGLLNQGELEWWLAIPMGVVGLDAVSYGWHRANHRVPLLWRFHQVHHSDPNFTATTGLRFHFGELLLALPIRLAAVALMGISIPGVIVFEVVFAFATFFEHGDIDLPLDVERRLAYVAITPALHRRHHGNETRLLNSNYGTILSCWDRAFGSFGENSSDVQVRVGLPGQTGPVSPRDALAMPIRGIFGQQPS